MLMVIVAFPFLNQFRYGYSTFDLSSFFNMYLDLHFDAFQNMCFLLKQEFIIGSNQFWDSILFPFLEFFTGRNPLGSGFLMAKKYELGYANISMPFFAEGYVSFGIVGCFAFSILLSVLITLFDKYLYVRKVYLAIMMSILFYLLRGDLLSSTMHIIKFIIIVFIMELLVFVSLKLKSVSK